MLTGACLARAGLNRKTGLATLALVGGAEMPDIDDVWYFIGGSISGLQHHRGFTHTLLGAPVVAAATLGCVYLVYRLMRWRGRQPRLPVKWRNVYLCALLVSLLHIFQDFTNNYGVRPFAPFNPRWYSWDIVFIIDPFMLIALFLGLVLPGLFALIGEEVASQRKSGFRGRGGAITALICLVLIILVRDFEHGRAVSALNQRIYQNQAPLRASAFPTMWSPFSWNGVVETRDFFEVLPVNSNSGEVDPENVGVVHYKPEETPATLAAKNSWLGRVYLDWAAYPLVEAEVLPNNSGYIVQFMDLRFSSFSALRRGRGPVLGGFVVLDPRLHVVEQYLGPRRDAAVNR